MNVMKHAWEIAKSGAKKFGGNPKEYFSQALKLAWILAKKGKVAKVVDSVKSAVGKFKDLFLRKSDSVVNVEVVTVVESLGLSKEQSDTLYQMFLAHLSQGLTLITDFVLWVKEYFKYRTEFINLLEVR